MASKLEKLAEIEDKTIEQLLRDATFDSGCAGICMNEDCDYTTEVEPDQTMGYCEECDTQTVKSCLIIAGII